MSKVKLFHLSSRDRKVGEDWKPPFETSNELYYFYVTWRHATIHQDGSLSTVCVSYKYILLICLYYRFWLTVFFVSMTLQASCEFVCMLLWFGGFSWKRGQTTVRETFSYFLRFQRREMFAIIFILNKHQNKHKKFY